MLERGKTFKLLSVLLVLSFFVCCILGGGFNETLNPEEAEAGNKFPKYVILLIGDGMGVSQIQAAEYFLQEKTGDPNAKLTMNTLPVSGFITTHSANSLITDSAAAGTALASGFKTNNRMIGKLPDGRNIKTLLEGAEEKGKATGIVTSTRVTHATPAVFMAHNEHRNNENEIAEDIFNSGVDFLAGGGIRHFVPKDWQWGRSKRKDNRNLIQEFHENGYRIFLDKYSTDDFRNYKPVAAERVVALFTPSHLPYEVDRQNNNETPSLSELTEKALEVLKIHDRRDGKGFFLMVEGGRIDHACHANDPIATIHDTLEFDRAVKKVYEFYKKYPNDTLFVVLSDHETGGMGLGYGKNYFMNMESLLNAKVSAADTLQKIYTGDRTATYKYLAENYGLTNLTDEEKAAFEKAMDIIDNKVETKAYGGYNPVGMTAAHVISKRANLFWTSWAHTADPVPVNAIGVGANNFAGFKDNTDIAKELAKLMRVELGIIDNPAYKKAS